MHCEGDIEKLILKFEAAPEVANTHDWTPEVDADVEREFQVRGVMREERGHVRRPPLGRKTEDATAFRGPDGQMSSPHGG